MNTRSGQARTARTQLFSFIFTTFTTLTLLGTVSIAHAQVTARAELNGVRHAGPGAVVDSNATFAIGLSLDGGATFVQTARLADNVGISGIIRPEAEHVGQTADIFVVDRLNIVAFTMRNPDGIYIPWNGSVAELVPFRENQVLTPEVSVDIFTGMLGNAGDHRLFMGYMPADGILRYNVDGHRVDITSQSVREQAEELFATNISPNIVHTVCIACHVAGGVAEGQAIHIFVPAFNSDHLAYNFGQLENLVNARSRPYVLDKVTGGNGHFGGAVLPMSTQEYRDFDTFLTLLEQL